MSTHTTIHLLRHGEVHNPEKILYGRLPGYRLSDRGERMAELAAADLAKRPVSMLVSSPLDRARATAEPLARALGLGLHIDERLIEAGNRFEGRRFGHGDGSLRRPANWPLVVDPFTPSWGEPYRRIAERMEEAVTAMREAVHRLYGGGDVVAVSHQLPIWTLRRHLEGKPLWHDPRRRECNLASVTTLEYDGDRLVGLSYREPAAELYPGAAQIPGA